MSSDEDYESDGGEAAEIEGDVGPSVEKAKPTKLSAFLAMVLSGVLSLFIASVMFSIGVLWEYREDARELRGLVQFFSTEVADLYDETSEAAELQLVHGELLERSAPRMISAVSLSRANALRVDPTLMSTIRSIYGRQSRVLRDLEAYKGGGKWHQMKAVIEECRAMSAEVRHVLEIASDEGVGAEALKPLKEALAEADERIDAVVAKKEEVFPPVWVTEKITSISLVPGKTATRNFLVRNWSGDETLAITGAEGSFEGIKVLLPAGTTVEPLGETKIDFEIAPEGLEPGTFEEKIVLRTDRKGFETMTIPISGKVYPPR